MHLLPGCSGPNMHKLTSSLAVGLASLQLVLGLLAAAAEQQIVYLQRNKLHLIELDHHHYALKSPDLEGLGWKTLVRRGSKLITRDANCTERQFDFDMLDREALSKIDGARAELAAVRTLEASEPDQTVLKPALTVGLTRSILGLDSVLHAGNTFKRATTLPGGMTAHKFQASNYLLVMLYDFVSQVYKTDGVVTVLNLDSKLEMMPINCLGAPERLTLIQVDDKLSRIEASIRASEQQAKLKALLNKTTPKPPSGKRLGSV